jgi:hypothetical protein
LVPEGGVTSEKDKLVEGTLPIWTNGLPLFFTNTLDGKGIRNHQFHLIDMHQSDLENIYGSLLFSVGLNNTI